MGLTETLWLEPNPAGCVGLEAATMHFGELARNASVDVVTRGIADAFNSGARSTAPHRR
jgi:hypothetical protein